MEITNSYQGTLEDGEFPDVVYKFRNWNSIFHKQFILNREIFLAEPQSFEDELDCKIPLRYDLMSKEQILQYAIYWSKIGNPNLTQKQHRLAARHFLWDKLFQDEKYLEEYREDYFKRYNQRIGILSLTTDSRNNDMWKKYADEHKGICIGYNSRIMFEYLGGGGAVHYVDDLPLIFPEPIMTHHQIRATQVYSKLRKWEFEKEYRTMDFWESPATDEQRKKSLPREAFHSVILGKNISTENKKEIIHAVKNNLGDIPILQSTLY